jgi:hypothetical protein
MFTDGLRGIPIIATGYCGTRPTGKCFDPAIETPTGEYRQKVLMNALPWDGHTRFVDAILNRQAKTLTSLDRGRRHARWPQIISRPKCSWRSPRKKPRRSARSYCIAKQSAFQSFLPTPLRVPTAFDSHGQAAAGSNLTLSVRSL